MIMGDTAEETSVSYHLHVPAPYFLRYLQHCFGVNDS